MTFQYKMTLFCFIAATILIPLATMAQAIPDPATGDAFVQALVAAVTSGNFRYAAVLGVVGLTFVIRVYGPRLPKVGPYLATSRAGAITALVLALLTTLAPALAGFVPWSVKLVGDAFIYGFAAIGGWVGVRRIIGVVPAPAPVPRPVPAPPVVPAS